MQLFKRSDLTARSDSWRAMVKVVFSDTAEELFPRSYAAAAHQPKSNAEVGSSRRISICPSRNASIRGLAEACAASYIQAIWRGRLQRKGIGSSSGKLKAESDSHCWKGKGDDCGHLDVSGGPLPVRKCSESKLGEKGDDGLIDTKPSKSERQRFENKGVQTDAATSESLPDVQRKACSDEYLCEGEDHAPIACDFPDGVDGNSSRTEAVAVACKTALDEWKMQPIVMDGIEVVNVLHALGLVEGKELRALSEASTSTHRGKAFTLRLDGPLKSFRADILAHWESISTDGVGKGSFASRTGRQSRLSSKVAKLAKTHLLNLIDLPTAAIAFLEDNRGVVNCTEDIIQSLVMKLGLHASTTIRWTIDLRNSCRSLELASSFLQRRIDVASDVVDFITRWEAAVKFERYVALESERDGPFSVVVEGLRRSVVNLRAQLEEKDATILHLNDQIVRMSASGAAEGDDGEAASSTSRLNELLARLRAENEFG